jgi:hypothetical protein
MIALIPTVHRRTAADQILDSADIPQKGSSTELDGEFFAPASRIPTAARRTLWHVLGGLPTCFGTVSVSVSVSLPTCFGTVSLPLPRGALLRLGQLSPRRHAWLEWLISKNHERQITRFTPTPCARIDPDSYQQ